MIKNVILVFEDHILYIRSAYYLKAFDPEIDRVAKHIIIKLLYVFQIYLSINHDMVFMSKFCSK